MCESHHAKSAFRHARMTSTRGEATLRRQRAARKPTVRSAQPGPSDPAQSLPSAGAPAGKRGVPANKTKPKASSLHGSTLGGDHVSPEWRRHGPGALVRAAAMLEAGAKEIQGSPGGDASPHAVRQHSGRRLHKGAAQVFSTGRPTAPLSTRSDAARTSTAMAIAVAPWEREPRAPGAPGCFEV